MHTISWNLSDSICLGRSSHNSSLWGRDMLWSCSLCSLLLWHYTSYSCYYTGDNAHPPDNSHWHYHINWHTCLPWVSCWRLCSYRCSSWGRLCQNSHGSLCILDTRCWLCPAGPDSLWRNMCLWKNHQLCWFFQLWGSEEQKNCHLSWWLSWWGHQWWGCSQCKEEPLMLENCSVSSTKYRLDFR